MRSPTRTDALDPASPATIEHVNHADYAGSIPTPRRKEAAGCPARPILPSAATTRVLERVGRTLGARDGTGPDDTPWLRRQRAEGREAGHAEGHATGHAEGRLEGLVESRARLLNVVIRRTLASRGISNDVTLNPADLAGLADEDVMDALLRCRDAADLRVRLRSRCRRDE